MEVGANATGGIGVDKVEEKRNTSALSLINAAFLSFRFLARPIFHSSNAGDCGASPFLPSASALSSHSYAEQNADEQPTERSVEALISFLWLGSAKSPVRVIFI